MAAHSAREREEGDKNAQQLFEEYLNEGDGEAALMVLSQRRQENAQFVPSGQDLGKLIKLLTKRGLFADLQNHSGWIGRAYPDLVPYLTLLQAADVIGNQDKPMHGLKLLDSIDLEKAGCGIKAACT